MITEADRKMVAQYCRCRNSNFDCVGCSYEGKPRCKTAMMQEMARRFCAIVKEDTAERMKKNEQVN